MRGAEAVIRWGYHTAARLGSWTITQEGTQPLKVTAKVLDSDTVRAAQQPLTFDVSRPQGRRWRWPVESLQFVGSEMIAQLGPQEE